MWHKYTKWANAVGQMALTDLPDIQGWHKPSMCKKQYLQSTTKWSAVKWGVRVFTY